MTVVDGIMEGDVIRTMRENKDYIGHIHTGGVPGRGVAQRGAALALSLPPVHLR